MNQMIKTRRIKTMLDSKIVLIVMLIVAFIIGKSTFFMMQQKKEAKRMVDNISLEYKELNERLSSAKSDLDYMNSDTGKEKEIREKFDLRRDGEKAIFIVEEKLPDITTEKQGVFDNILTKIGKMFGITK